MSAPADKPPIEFTNEIRYAVVMYGGVSLCIYINGVAQELLELVRATAPDASESAARIAKKDLSASAKVYRRIAQYLDSDTFKSAILAEDHPHTTIRTRFVVDVLSGTSAGGLNSIFLAKALANDKNMDGLKQLWMNEADIALLLNDKGSNMPGLGVRGNPQSLLNSQRMYEKLLTALHEMDFPLKGKDWLPPEPDPKTAPSSLVRELDLYVTATDIRGLPVHIRLDNADKPTADELRHRNVFRFRYGTLSSDFGYDNNPFLAFAGRCTSAIPPAFEPMRLQDIEPVLRTWPAYRSLVERTRKDWSKFYSDYDNTPQTGDFWQRDFGDGGFLDNKPFSYATSSLMRRQAEHPVTRKLVYIEPNPQPLDNDTDETLPKPNALQHSLAALIGLPRYETIREDLEVVLERNRLLEQIDAVTRDVDYDVARGLTRDTLMNKERHVAAADYAATPLKDLIKERGRGISYGIYHRLKVADVTAELAELVSDLLDLPQSSDECTAVRRIVEAWRKRWFVEDPPANAKDQWPKTETRFLLDFDPGYRLRRLYFLHRKISYFYRFPRDAGLAMSPEELARALPQDIAALLHDAASWQRFRDALIRIKHTLAGPVLTLRLVTHNLREDKELAARAKQVLPPEDVRECLRRPERADRLVRDPQRQSAFTEFSGEIAARYIEVFKKNSDEILNALKQEHRLTHEEQVARSELWRLHCQFDFYDMAILPVQSGAGTIETPHVEIIRVSPGDAKNLCENQPGRQKLAGTEFFSFGAFFAKFWRNNDMLWGRLDGAEILVRNLLAGTKAARDLAADDPAFQNHSGLKTAGDRARKKVVDLVVDDVQTAILHDHLSVEQRKEIWEMLERTLPHVDREDLDEQIGRFFDDSTGLRNAMLHIIDFCRDDQELLDHYKTSYAVDRRLDRGQMVGVAGRATKILGRMLQGISEDSSNKVGQEFATVMLRTAAVLNGVIELSLPRRPGELLWRYWRSLLYVMGAALFLVGLLFNIQAVQKGGLLILLVTGAAHVATTIVELWIVRRWTALKGVFATILALLLTVIFALGVWKAFDVSRSIGTRALHWVQAIRKG